MSSSLQKHRLRISKFVVEFREGRNMLLMVMRNDRNDLPHLSISFNNPSKFLNIHLTKRVSGKPDHRIDVARIYDADVAVVLSSLVSVLRHTIIQHLIKLKPVRPGWLARKGYIIVLFDENIEKVLLDTMIPARRYHNKNERFVDGAAFEKYVHSVTPENHIFHPSILHHLSDGKHDTPVFAVRIHGRRRPEKIGLLPLVKQNGNLAWFNVNKLVTLIGETGENHLISSLVQLLPKNSWRIIYDEMQLQELGIDYQL